MNNSLNTKRGLTRSRRSRSSAVAPFLTRRSSHDSALSRGQCARAHRARQHARPSARRATRRDRSPGVPATRHGDLCGRLQQLTTELETPPTSAAGDDGTSGQRAVSSDCQNEAALHTRTQDDPENTVYGTKQKQVQMLESAVFNGRRAAAVTMCGTAGRPCEHARELSARSF